MDLKAKRDSLQAAQAELVGQINYIRGQLSIVEELIAEEEKQEAPQASPWTKAETRR